MIKHKPIDIEKLFREKGGDGFLFIHHPKTAGRYVATVMYKWQELAPQGLGPQVEGNKVDGASRLEIRENAYLAGHSSANSDEVRFYDSKINTFKGLRFAVIRNPLDYITSEYYHSHSGSGFSHEMTFPVFLQKWFDSSSTQPLLQQTERKREISLERRKFIYHQSFDATGHPAVDFFIRYEYLEPALNELWGLRSDSSRVLTNPKDVESFRHRAGVTSHRPGKQTYTDLYKEWELDWSNIPSGLKEQCEFWGYNMAGPVDSVVFLDPSEIKK